VRVLLDESVPRQLAPRLAGHAVVTAQHAGCGGQRNGELLRRATGQFDVLVTGDQSLEYQQKVRHHGIAVVVVAARNNRVETILALTDLILSAIAESTPGSVTRVSDRS
jgi:hypothetical protein